MTEVPTTLTPELPDSGLPPELQAAAAGETLTDRQERSGLDWLLGATVALEYDLPIDYETPDGMRKLIFHFRQIDPSVFEEKDEENRRGDGPFAKLDVKGYNQAIVQAAGISLTDVGTGKVVMLDSQEFLGGVPSPAIAVGLRFKNQGGLLEGIVGEIRKVSGYSADRIGTATRQVVQAGKVS